MIRSLLSKFGLSGSAPDLSGIWVDRPTYAVGDIHGRADLLDTMIEQIGKDAAGHGDPHPRVVFLGDYVDRGDQSCQVLERLQGLARETGWETHFLRGNHEVMVQEFLTTPEAAAPRWFRNGGLETLLSYQVGGIGTDAAALFDMRNRLVARMGPVVDWLGQLLPRYSAGSVVFAHAGAEPHIPIEQQSEQTFYWGAPGFLEVPRKDGIWVVHGHYIFETPQLVPQRIGIDTGAFHSGQLTAVRIEDEAVRFLTT